jgi:hypothetical protein
MCSLMVLSTGISLFIPVSFRWCGIPSKNQITIGGVNVPLPYLLKPIPKSAIVLFRQMIWRISKSQGGIVNRKIFHMMF